MGKAELVQCAGVDEFSFRPRMTDVKAHGITTKSPHMSDSSVSSYSDSRDTRSQVAAILSAMVPKMPEIRRLPQANTSTVKCAMPDAPNINLAAKTARTFSRAYLEGKWLIPLAAPGSHSH